MLKRIITIGCMLLIAACFAGCSGGSDGGGVAPPQTPTISGVASKGPILGGTVSVYAVTSAGQKGALLATTTTSTEDGSYSVTISSTGPVLIEVTGGQYKDEASEETVDLTIPMRAVIPSVNGNLSVAVTPLTELAAQEAEKAGLSPAAIMAANAKVSQLLGAGGDILATEPFDIFNETQFENASDAQKTYTFLLAALSEWASEHGAGITGVMDDLADDLADNLLDDTGANLSDALLAYGEDVPSGLTDIIAALADDGFAPTGTLAEAKSKLTALMNEDPPTAATYNEFIAYMDGFTADSAEAHLFKALAGMMDLYNSDAVAFITNGDTGLGLDFDFNFDQLDEDKPDFDEVAFEALRDRAIELATDENLAGLFAELETRLTALDAELAQAEGSKASLSLTGLDTVYFDTIDVKVMRSMVAGFTAVCAYIQAIDLDVTNWNVTVENTPTDIRELLADGVTITVALRDEFIANNPNLLTYDDLNKRTAFAAAVGNLRTHLAAAVSLIEARDEAGLQVQSRADNAFTLESERDLYEAKVFVEEMLPSIITAFGDPAANLTGMDLESKPSAFYNPGDGYVYQQKIYDISLIEVAPALGSDLTLGALMSGYTTPRDVAQAAIDAADASQEFAPYVQNSSWTLYRENVTETNWDMPYEIYEVPLALSLNVDGSNSEWGTVPVFEAFGGVTVKLARNSAGRLFAHVANPTEGYFSFNLHSRPLDYHYFVQPWPPPFYLREYGAATTLRGFEWIVEDSEYEVEFEPDYQYLAFSESVTGLSLYSNSVNLWKNIKILPEAGPLPLN